MALISNTKAISPNRTVQYKLLGDFPAEAVFSIVPGDFNIGGVIDPVTGVYTAPNAHGSETIQAEVIDPADSTSQIFTSVIQVLPMVALLANIICECLELDTDQVWIWNQKLNKLKTEKMQVVVTERNPNLIGNTNTLDQDDGLSFQVARFMSTMVIDIFSAGTEVLYRKDEVVMALNSGYSQRQQEYNGFKICNVPLDFVNLSEIDGMEIPYRYNITVNVFYSKLLKKQEDFYCSYKGVQVHAAETVEEVEIGDLESIKDIELDCNFIITESGEVIET